MQELMMHHKRVSVWNKFFVKFDAVLSNALFEDTWFLSFRWFLLFDGVRIDREAIPEAEGLVSTGTNHSFAIGWHGKLQDASGVSCEILRRK